MSYFVTFGGFDHHHRPTPAALDLGSPPRGFDVEDALAHARELLREGKQHVKTADDSGHSISGDDLSACCRGEKTLTADLSAISNWGNDPAVDGQLSYRPNDARASRQKKRFAYFSMSRCSLVVSPCVSAF